jgi:phosphatidate phosphatase APP1
MPFTKIKLPIPEITLELEEGGSLEAGATYYFVFVFVAGTSDGYLNARGFYYERLISQRSEELSITIEDTRRAIKVTVHNDRNSLRNNLSVFARWDKNPIVDVNNDIIDTFSNKWFPNVLYNTSIFKVGYSGVFSNEFIIADSTTLLSAALQGHVDHPSLSIPSGYKTIADYPTNLDFSEIMGLYITGAESYSSLKAFVQNDDELPTHFSFIKNGFSTNCLIVAASSSTLSFSDLIISVFSNYLYYCSSFIFTNCILHYDRHAMWIFIYGNYINSRIQSPNCTTIDIRSSTFIATSIRTPSTVVQYSGTSGISFFNTIFRVNCQAYFLLVTHSNIVMQRIWIDATIRILKFHSITFINKDFTSYDINISGFNAPGVTADFELLDCMSNRVGGVIVMRWLGSEGTKQWRDSLRFQHTYSVAYNVLNEAGNVLTNVTVTLTDALGVTYINPVQVLSYETKRNDAIPSLMTDQIQHNPFTLKIEKEGYQTYHEILTIFEKQSKTISLKANPTPIPFTLRRLVTRIFASLKPIAGSQEQVNEIEGVTDDDGLLLIEQNRRITYNPDLHQIIVEAQNEEEFWEEIQVIDDDCELTEQYSSLVPDPLPAIADFEITHSIERKYASEKPVAGSAETLDDLTGTTGEDGKLIITEQRRRLYDITSDTYKDYRPVNGEWELVEEVETGSALQREYNSEIPDPELNLNHTLIRNIERIFESELPIIDSAETVNEASGVTDDEGKFVITQQRRLIADFAHNKIKTQYQNEDEEWIDVNEVSEGDVIEEAYKSVVPDIKPVIISKDLDVSLNPDTLTESLDDELCEELVSNEFEATIIIDNDTTN